MSRKKRQLKALGALRKQRRMTNRLLGPKKTPYTRTISSKGRVSYGPTK